MSEESKVFYNYPGDAWRGRIETDPEIIEHLDQLGEYTVGHHDRNLHDEMPEMTTDDTTPTQADANRYWRRHQPDYEQVWDEFGRPVDIANHDGRSKSTADLREKERRLLERADKLIAKQEAKEKVHELRDRLSEVATSEIELPRHLKNIVA